MSFLVDEDAQQVHETSQMFCISVLLLFCLVYLLLTADAVKQRLFGTERLNKVFMMVTMTILSLLSEESGRNEAKR